MSIRVLIFPCGSEIGLELHRSLKDLKDLKLVGASSVSDHGEYVYKNYVSGLPNIDDIDFISEINRVISDNNIDFIIPAHDSVVLKLAENSNSLKCPYIGSPLETAKICRSKRKTYEYFECFLKTPKMYTENVNASDFPLFLKPDVGQGSKGCFFAKTNKDLMFYRSLDSSLLILEYLPGEEFTVDCFTDFKGKVIFAEPRKRIRILNGISARTSAVDYSQEFKDFVETINSKLQMQGAWFFQVKRNKQGDLVLLEIAPRIAGTMGMYRNLGINFAQLGLLDKQNIPLEIIRNNYAITLDRCFQNKFKIDLNFSKVYVDFDDTLIINGVVNHILLSFLYQCLNKKLDIFLITKHSGAILTTLDSFKISSNIFKKIYHLDKEEEKVNFIADKDSVFIDDSFVERKKVFTKLGVPCFSLDMIESLLDFKI